MKDFFQYREELQESWIKQLERDIGKGKELSSQGYDAVIHDIDKGLSVMYREFIKLNSDPIATSKFKSILKKMDKAIESAEKSKLKVAGKGLNKTLGGMFSKDLQMAHGHADYTKSARNFLKLFSTLNKKMAKYQ